MGLMIDGCQKFQASRSFPFSVTLGLTSGLLCIILVHIEEFT